MLTKLPAKAPLELLISTEKVFPTLYGEAMSKEYNGISLTSLKAK